ncbi:hypothetical protein [Paraburkholderia sp. BL25I1N1]|uniref:hypothetical protein n=1 Tax=Paraburkholderia sp. BL25I1N1 TaxID=1938804 RepID=UPI0011B21791|nr:hypothetical protein [Paraburkholderia sp. BL25I1N1]
MSPVIASSLNKDGYAKPKQRSGKFSEFLTHFTSRSIQHAGNVKIFSICFTERFLLPMAYGVERISASASAQAEIFRRPNGVSGSPAGALAVGAQQSRSAATPSSALGLHGLHSFVRISSYLVLIIQIYKRADAGFDLLASSYIEGWLCGAYCT